MARITVVDCLKNVEEGNQFKLIIQAAELAHKLSSGEVQPSAWSNHKPTVLALKEIAAGNFSTKDEQLQDY